MWQGEVDIMTHKDIIEYGKKVFGIDLTIESNHTSGTRLVSQVDLPDIYANSWINFKDHELTKSEKQWTASASSIIARRLKIYAGSTSDGKAQILSEKTISKKSLPGF